MTVNSNGKVHVGSTFRWVHLREIRKDDRVQRELRTGWVAKHLPLFNPEDLGAIVLSRRDDGHYYVLDGQHRVELLRQVGWGDQQVYAEVFEGLTLEQEGYIFLNRNEKITVKALDKFKVRVTVHEPTACDINRIVQGLGLRIGGGKSAQRTISAISALEKVYSGAGIGPSRQLTVLRDTLRILRESWGDDSTSFEGYLIQGLGKVLVRYNTHVDPAKMIHKLASYPAGAPGLMGNARGRNISGGRLADTVAEVIVDIYNKGGRGKTALDPWRSAMLESEAKGGSS